MWCLAEGRCPWASGLDLPQHELRDIDSGVWSLSAGSAPAACSHGAGPLSGPAVLVTGTDVGVVQAWDLREAGGESWKQSKERRAQGQCYMLVLPRSQTWSVCVFVSGRLSGFSSPPAVFSFLAPGPGRAARALWKSQVAEDYIGGLQLDPVAGR